ncbi:glucuronate isomerase [Flavobacteriaceae bacterium TP-CH-4]|uniref:Uronate isomerase n=1 Tax=Pelagihabitans pacificus TaxID=2696054 RepID=A0A967E9L6_9FLAO|nr:glucuronate isomerase [Pelagihabitans pacificus]NHF58591.1 glucuronate isomerase [Pelagihabitans pacificus]
MKTFITDDFLLQNAFAKRLYHDHAKDLPIIDYHNHLPPAEIAQNRVFENISQVWLAGDHYKWRAMRALGIDEHYITGAATDKEKFLKWAETVPYTVRNPLYHWTHLELHRYFGIDSLLSATNAEAVYETTSNRLQEASHHTVGLLHQHKVEYLCTTDDPTDSLEHHTRIRTQKGTPKVYPTFRPDKAFAVEDATAYKAYLQKLETAVNSTIATYADLLQALENRIDYFHEQGGRLADHGLEQLYYFDEKRYDCEKLFQQVQEGRELTPDEVAYFKANTLVFLCRAYHAKGWTQQFHLGALRNNNKRLLGILGPDTGFDSMGDFSQAKALSRFLNDLDSTNQLAKTVLYNLNPADDEVFATMAGNFNDGSIKGKVQYGSAWWFLDQKDGMEKQLNTLSNMGLLSCFVGMLTDSRSFLSFPRHEYFRRILCNLIGTDVENGELPADEKWLGKIVGDICYHNAKGYFGL